MTRLVILIFRVLVLFLFLIGYLGLDVGPASSASAAVFPTRTCSFHSWFPQTPLFHPFDGSHNEAFPSFLYFPVTQFPTTTAVDFILAVRNLGTTLKLLASPFSIVLFFKRKSVLPGQLRVLTTLINKVACVLMIRCHISLVDKLSASHVNILGTIHK